MAESVIRVGLISDTHGFLRREALEQLQGSDLIIHAGDVGAPDIVPKLQEIAPVAVVRGNIDKGDWASDLASSAALEVGEVAIYALHNLNDIDLHPDKAGFQVVVYGHTHKPAQRKRSGVLYINPGSAGPLRFRLPVTIAFLDIEGTSIRTRFVDLTTGEDFEPEIERVN